MNDNPTEGDEPRRSVRLKNKSGQEVIYVGKFNEDELGICAPSDPCSAKCLQTNLKKDKIKSKSKPITPGKHKDLLSVFKSPNYPVKQKDSQAKGKPDNKTTTVKQRSWSQLSLLKFSEPVRRATIVNNNSKQLFRSDTFEDLSDKSQDNSLVGTEGLKRHSSDNAINRIKEVPDVETNISPSCVYEDNCKEVLEYISFDKESVYDTCESSEEEEDINLADPHIVTISSLEVSTGNMAGSKDITTKAQVNSPVVNPVDEYENLNLRDLLIWVEKRLTDSIEFTR